MCFGDFLGERTPVMLIIKSLNLINLHFWADLEIKAPNIVSFWPHLLIFMPKVPRSSHRLALFPNFDSSRLVQSAKTKNYLHESKTIQAPHASYFC